VQLWSWLKPFQYRQQICRPPLGLRSSVLLRGRQDLLCCRGFIRDLTIVLALFCVGGGAAFAQDAKADDTKVTAGLEVWKTSGCSECHGPFADGDKQRDEAPTGANLRQTRLDNATIAETVRCGRPGAGMPSFAEEAYTTRGCYGQPAGPKPDDLYPAPRNLKPEEIEAVVTYLRARIVGHGAVTPQECAAYYGELASSFCDDAPK
jgi:mono/diheme cytochrome c family protein